MLTQLIFLVWSFIVLNLSRQQLKVAMCCVLIILAFDSMSAILNCSD